MRIGREDGGGSSDGRPRSEPHERSSVKGLGSAARRLVPDVRLGPLPRVTPRRIPVRAPRVRLRRLAPLLAVLGPGLIAGIAGNDAGGITTYSVLGARTGYVLLWLFPITIVVLAVVQEMAARLGTVTGQGLSDLIRDWFGVRWTAFAMLVLLLANLANTVAEFAGASAALEIFGVSRLITVPVLVVALWAVVVFASYRRLERLFLLVSLVFVTYIAAAYLAHPDGSQIVAGLTRPTLSVPGVPILETLLLAVALVGTTITPYMQFYLQSAVAEKGIGVEELRLERADAILGSVWTNVIAVCIVVATAATLFGTGVALSDAAQAAQALRPVAGDLSTVLFGTGLFGASVLAATIMPISTAFVICEAFGWESGVGKPVRDAPAFFGLFTFVLVVGAVLTLLPGLDLIGLIVSSQYLQGLLLPVVLIFMVLLVNNRRLMGRHTNGRGLNTLAILSVGLVIVLDAALLGASVLEGLGIRLR
jgi:Mn2+/Fe2+ NRAMP family transporter